MSGVTSVVVDELVVRKKDLILVIGGATHTSSPTHALHFLYKRLSERVLEDIDLVVVHVGNNISEKLPRRIGQGLNDVSCILGSMWSSLMGLPYPAWLFLGNVVSHMGRGSDS